jgi:glycosyltransferase involved in cell wall biosynthesis
MRLKLSAYYPIHFVDYGIAHVSYNLIKNMQSEELVSKLYGISSEEGFVDKSYLNLLTGNKRKLAYKLFSHKQMLKICDFLYILNLNNDHATHAYLLPGTSLSVYKKLNAKGVSIISEAVNNLEIVSKKLLDFEYKRLNIIPSHGIEGKYLDEANEKLLLSNYIFSPSYVVTNNFISNGFADAKLLKTSYGLAQESILPIDVVLNKKNAIPNFIFVGSVGVRKGVPLLLDYWIKANANATLTLVGKVDKEIEGLLDAAIKQNSNIKHIKFTNDLISIYKNADVFILPSIEEGSPLVTYLALGAGLPVLASPMGAGGIVDNEINGLIKDVYDEDGWVESIKRLAEDFDLRKAMGLVARNKASDYLWESVAKSRMESLINIEKTV